MSFNIEYSANFIKTIKQLSDPEIILIGNFISSLNESGFKSLPGRNKPSTGVSKLHVNRITLIQYAIRKKLWHYHIGYETYDETNKFGDWTSKYLVHYQKKGVEYLRFVVYDTHPPFRLPAPSMLI